jgi:glycosyltransferase involved in cell wall biosynthesis
MAPGPNAATPGASTTPPPTRAPRRPPLILIAIGAVRALAARSLDFPDVSRGWIMRAAATARGLLRDNAYDVVVSSGPPHLAHLAGVLATVGTDVPHWIDMRDPWSFFYARSEKRPFPVRLQMALISRMERALLARARGVIVNTPEFARELATSFPSERIHCVHNAVDVEMLPARSAVSADVCRMVHVGTLYARRNLTSVIDAMRAIVRDNPAAKTRLRLIVAGHINPEHRDRLVAALAREGLGQMVELHGVTPRDDALALLSGAHLALVLAQHQPYCVPAKLYECVALGVPTLAITERGSATEHEAARVGALSADPAEVNAVRSVLERALDGHLPELAKPVTPVSYEQRAVEIETLLLADAVGPSQRAADASAAGAPPQ